jgi:mannose-1-phosphate guanylyltransferase
VIRAGKNISYQVHHHRDEVWTFIDGEGQLVLDGVVTRVSRGDVINIKKGVRHAVRATTDLRFIEVQAGDMLIEEDIERFEWIW